ncbi:MAG: alpha/beta fold hydrolase [Candidatus Levybacteria bacterium]|nr:alpha/beta fold hydrolase [Candidatus Levybacteria bacterium]
MDKIANTSLPNEQQPKKPSKKQLVLATALFALVFLVLFFLFPKDASKNTASVAQTKTDGSFFNAATPTPMPFRELTVPYLREREYKSSLGEREVAYQGSNYTAYLTSYDSDGLKVNGLLTIPNQDSSDQNDRVERGSAGINEDKYPAIVFIHGYIPPSTYVTTQNYYDYVDYLARKGFVVFKIDLRGHGDSEGEPGGGYYGSDYVVDALNSRAALQSSGFVNPQKIGFWGHSMAGNIVMRSLAAQTDIPAVVIWAGAVYSYLDWQKYRINDNSYSSPQMSPQRQRRRQELFEKYGSPSATSVFWQQVAPTNYLGDIKGAIQLNHAVDDDVVNIGYSRDLVAMLDKTNIPHELHEYPTGGHNITGSSFVTAMNNTVGFFEKYLK